MNIYSLYSRTKKRYFTPFFAADDAAAMAQVVDMVMATNNQVVVQSLDDLELCHLGTFVEDDTEHNPLNESLDILLIEDDLIHKLPFPPRVRSQIFKLYNIEEDDSHGKA